MSLNMSALSIHLNRIDALIKPVISNHSTHYLSTVLLHGKRLRSRLCISGAAAYNININENIYYAASAIECIHMASLLHDDILDVAHTRRGALSTWKQNGAHLAVLGGDLLLTHSLTLACKTKSIEAIDLITKKTCKMVEGEILQNSPQCPFSQTYYARIIKHKTASLFEAAIMLAAPEHARTAVERIGTLIGMAFQIINDLKDYRCLTDDLPPGPDILQRRISAPLLWLLHHTQSPEQLKAAWNSKTDDIVSILKNEDILSMYKYFHTTITSIIHKTFAHMEQASMPNPTPLHHFIEQTFTPPLNELHALLT